VQHLDPRHETVIADVLGRRVALRVKLAEAGELARPGTVYVAPPDRHLLVGAAGMLRLTESERVNFVRPSADLLFDSMAASFGARALACVLTGTGRDGATGVAAVRAAGGTVIAQDEASSVVWGMPGAVALAGLCSAVLPIGEIGPYLLRAATRWSR